MPDIDYTITDKQQTPEIPDELPPPEVATINSYEPFEQAIVARVKQHFGETDMPTDLIERFGPAFAQEIDNMLAKFARGQIEHGGDIRDRDLRREMDHEIRDLMMYSLADKLKGTGVILYV